MQVVWTHGSVTVRDVIDAITRKLAYNTVLTMMKVLETKGFVARRKAGASTDVLSVNFAGRSLARYRQRMC